MAMLEPTTMCGTTLHQLVVSKPCRHQLRMFDRPGTTKLTEDGHTELAKNSTTAAHFILLLILPSPNTWIRIGCCHHRLSIFSQAFHVHGVLRRCQVNANVNVQSLIRGCCYAQGCVGETSEIMPLHLSGVRELPWRQVEHLLKARGWAGKHVLLDSLLVPRALGPLDSQEDLDVACSLLGSEVLDLVLYVELQTQERWAGQNSIVFPFFCWYEENQRSRFHLLNDQKGPAAVFCLHIAMTMWQHRITEYYAIDYLTKWKAFFFDKRRLLSCFKIITSSNLEAENTPSNRLLTFR